jgi:hypothetical protein
VNTGGKEETTTGIGNILIDVVYSNIRNDKRTDTSSDAGFQ